MGTTDETDVLGGKDVVGNAENSEASEWQAAGTFLQRILDAMLSLYVLLLIVVLPIYNQAGFVHIGTDKAMFVKRMSTYAFLGIVSLLLFILVLSILEGAVFYKKHGAYWTYQNGKRILQKILEKIIREASITDGFAILYAMSLLLSYFFSHYREQALWGARGWYMGLLPQFTLLGMYFLVSKAWKFRQGIFYLFLPVSAIVCFLGYLNRFSLYPLEMHSTEPSFISTIGNINWFCGYLVSVFFIAYYLWWNPMKEGANGKWKNAKSGNVKSENAKCMDFVRKEDARIGRSLLAIYLVLGFAMIVVQGSMSGFVSLAVIFFATFLASLRKGEKMQAFLELLWMFGLACGVTQVIRQCFPEQMNFKDPMIDLLTDRKEALLVWVAVSLCYLAFREVNQGGGYLGSDWERLFQKLGRGTCCMLAVGVPILGLLILLNTIQPGCLGRWSEYSFFTLNARWGSSRIGTWSAGWQCFLSQNGLHRFLGVGPDCMSAYIYTDGSIELIEALKGQFGSSRLTNAHSEWLTVLVNTGILGCFSFTGMIVSAICRFLKAGQRFPLMGACGLCLFAYTVNNLFSFQQAMNTTTLFLVFAMGEAYGKSLGDCLEKENVLYYISIFAHFGNKGRK